MDDIKYCSNCGNKLNSDSMFCDKCGQEVINDTKEIIKCPYCQSSLQKNIVKCPNCGEWIDKTQKPIRKNINNLFKKILNLTYIPAIVFIYAFINMIFYQIINIINHKYFTFKYDNSYFIPPFSRPEPYYYPTHEMDSFTQLIHQIGIILYGNLNRWDSHYTLLGGLTDSIDIIWFILFLISLIFSINVIKNKKNLKSYFYLILTIISYILMLFCSRTIQFNILPGAVIILIIILIINRNSFKKLK